MKNPLMSRLLGENTGDVVPVIANLPRSAHRDRMSKARKGEREGEDVDESSVRRMVEGNDPKEDAIIPDDAEDVDATEMTVGKPLRSPKEIVQEPSHPRGDKEKYQTPYAALTAPDVTPQATQPIDPSAVPGAAGAEKFTVADLERAEPESTEINAPSGGEDPAVKAMDVLLGRKRTGAPAKNTAEFQQAGDITTEEQAAAMMGIKTPIQEEAAAKAAQAMVASTEGTMPPPPPPGDGSQIYSAFRRFAG